MNFLLPDVRSCQFHDMSPKPAGLFTLINLVLLTGTAVLGYLVFLAPAPHLDRKAIQQRLLTETIVYYRDQRTKLGAFYDQSPSSLPAGQPTNSD